MTIKKFRLGYESYMLKKIKWLEQALEKFYQSETSDNLTEQTQEERDKLQVELSEKLPMSQYEPILISEREIHISKDIVITYYTAREVYIYQDIAYQISETHSDEECKLLVLEFVDKERRKFEQLKNKFSGIKSEDLKYERLRIPESVRIAVWRRDQGKCARCESRENLEYDHIVPVSKGGGNTERNIELLCQNCNRVKGNRIE